ncbi:oxidoreductase [Mucilaginibacter gynuensis]|uniref:Oxidoreductase n=1 Tax=Mucilaginibacter gynuensis TaxID=1302236 RepID=A0ABP8HND0_9SPHI
MKKFCLLIACFTLFVYRLNAQTIQIVEQGKPASIRGLSVVDDNVAWASGSRGYVAKSTDGGTSWAWKQVKGYEKADFRDIEAFSDKEAVIIASGTPALILKTTDGGESWQLKYNNADTTYFLDAMDFSTPQHGWVLGDPINGKFLLMETNDGGNTWASRTDIAPAAATGEAAFAASGTCLRVVKNNLFIVTGGTVTHLIQSANNGKQWQHQDIPVAHGQGAKGAFSLAVNGKDILITGGNYEKDKLTDSVACYFQDKKWVLPATYPAGYQSGAEHIKGSTYLSTGTPGSNITTDGGKTWKQIDATSFNVCRKARRGNLVLLAGNGGKIGILKF